VKGYFAFLKCGIQAFCFFFYWKILAVVAAAVVVCFVNGCGGGGEVSCGVLHGEEGRFALGPKFCFSE
jgi:hypothetical protein